MAGKQTLLLWSLVATSVACLSLGGVALRVEAGSAVLGAGPAPARQFLGLMEANRTIPLSVQGRRAILGSCEMALRLSAPLALRFVSEQQRAMMVPICGELAQASVDAARTDAYARLVLAKSHIRGGEMGLASQSIVLSGALGPAESWIARVRFDLVQDNYQALSRSAQAVGDADTILLLPGQHGAVVARRYILDDAFRRRAAGLIETQPEDVQRRFVALVRRQVQER